jgi:hypothetical protein
VVVSGFRVTAGPDVVLLLRLAGVRQQVASDLSRVITWDTAKRDVRQPRERERDHDPPAMPNPSTSAHPLSLSAWLMLRIRVRLTDLRLQESLRLRLELLDTTERTEPVALSLVGPRVASSLTVDLHPADGISESSLR